MAFVGQICNLACESVALALFGIPHHPDSVFKQPVKYRLVRYLRRG